MNIDFTLKQHHSSIFISGATALKVKINLLYFTGDNCFLFAMNCITLSEIMCHRKTLIRVLPECNYWGGKLFHLNWNENMTYLSKSLRKSWSSCRTSLCHSSTFIVIKNKRMQMVLKASPENLANFCSLAPCNATVLKNKSPSEPCTCTATQVNLWICYHAEKANKTPKNLRCKVG